MGHHFVKRSEFHPMIWLMSGYPRSPKHQHLRFFGGASAFGEVNPDGALQINSSSHGRNKGGCIGKLLMAARRSTDWSHWSMNIQSLLMAFSPKSLSSCEDLGSLLNIVALGMNEHNKWTKASNSWRAWSNALSDADSVQRVHANSLLSTSSSRLAAFGSLKYSRIC